MTFERMPSSLVIIAIVVAVAYLGGRFTSKGLGPWYDALKKPSWTPPGSVIGFVWTVIYVLTGMAAIAAWRQVRAGGAIAAMTALFLANATLNVAWCYVFFARKRLRASVAVIAALEATILALIVVLWQPSRIAAWLLVPYAAWVAFAGTLNAVIARRNLFRTRT